MTTTNTSNNNNTNNIITTTTIKTNNNNTNPPTIPPPALILTVHAPKTNLSNKPVTSPPPVIIDLSQSSSSNNNNNTPSPPASNISTNGNSKSSTPSLSVSSLNQQQQQQSSDDNNLFRQPSPDSSTGNNTNKQKSTSNANSSASSKRPLTPLASSLSVKIKQRIELLNHCNNTTTIATAGFFSFEYFPPKTAEGTVNLLRRIDIMAKKGPMWIDVTSSPGNVDQALDICADAIMYCGVEAMLHVTTVGWKSEQELRAYLERARSRGVRSIMALKGDLLPATSSSSTTTTIITTATTSTTPELSNTLLFPNASSLVTFIRKEFGDSFTIGVAGYPESSSKELYVKGLESLKEKFDAGADFCVTQLFFDIQLFFTFVQDCRAMGITQPIIPGLMPIQLYKVFHRTVQYLGTTVPVKVMESLETIKHDDAAVRLFGANLCYEMAAELLQSKTTPGVHFFTLNLERTCTIVVDRLCTNQLLEYHKQRELPWKQSAHEKRAHEDVRPIFWSNNPKSYVARTQEWDEFPNGRWGDASSPAYGELKGSHYYQATYSKISDRRISWGESPQTVADLAHVFVGYVEGRVPSLPWSESGLALETGAIRDSLIQLNQNGFLTINSQPRVNGVSSSDSNFGWGYPNGFVYQKAYIEFFVHESGARKLAETIDTYYDNLAYHAVNAKNEQMRKTRGGDGPCAVTWGVFPGREVIQPTIVDPTSFLAWKDEAFELWISAWASVYSDDSASYDLIWKVHDSFFLMNIVDNDYISGNIFSVFERADVLTEARKGLEVRGGVL
jgi:methylenetetrahydrofolate reductase (NADPH)